MATLIGAGLFVVGACPLLLVRELPYQDLPNHLATAEILLHRAQYPEFAFHGFLKTNTALIAWLVALGPIIGLSLAAKLFTALTIAGTAFLVPRFVLAFAGPARMRTSALFAWAIVHPWFLAMGMLNFALAVPIALALLLALRAQAIASTKTRAVLAMILAIALWYAHVFVLAMVGLLIVLHAAIAPTWKERAERAWRLLGPLVPAGILVLLSVVDRLSTRSETLVKPFPVGFHTPLDLAYGLWAEYAAAFTERSLPSAVVTVSLVVFAWRRRRESPMFFGPVALGVFTAAYVLVPYNALNWAYVDSRFLVVLYLASLLRVPDSLPRFAAIALGACAVSYAALLCVDYVRLDGDRARFTAGVDAVPEGSRLLPVLFRTRVSSTNTWSLHHAWGYYLLAKHTSAPFAFADSRSYPITFVAPPPPVVARALAAESMASEDAFCARLRDAGAEKADCRAAWREEWRTFWVDAASSFDHLLVWYAPKEVLATVDPTVFRSAFREGDLVILERAAP